MNCTISWIETNSSTIQLLGLFPKDLKNVSKFDLWSNHSRSLFKAAIILANRSNFTFGGHHLGWHESTTENDVMSALSCACEKVLTSHIVGIVGPAYSNEVRFISPFAYRTGIPIVGYAATNPDLSDLTSNEAFYRLPPSDRVAAFAIAKLFQNFNWSSCTLIIENDDYGYGGLKVLQEEFSRTSIKIKNRLIFDRTTQRFASKKHLSETLLGSPSRIILVWANQNTTYCILKYALDADVTSPYFVWLLTNNVPMNLFTDQEQRKLIGILTIEPVVASVVGASSNKELLDKAYLIWQENDNLTFPGEMDVSSYALFTFDATWTLILALQELCNITNDICLKIVHNSSCFNVQLVNGTLLRSIIRQTTFLGVTGHVQFSNETTDRINGAYYILKNVQSLKKTKIRDYVPVLKWCSDENWTNHSNLTSIMWPNQQSTHIPDDHALMAGKKLRIAVIESPPFIIVKNSSSLHHSNRTNSVSYVGYSMDLIEHLRHTMNFHSDITLISSDISYDEIVRAVANETFDVVIADVTITARRTQIVDFSTSIHENVVRVVVRATSGTKVDFFSYFRPFSFTLWLALTGVVLYAAILLFIFERSQNKQLKARSLTDSAAMSVYYSTSSLVGLSSDFIATTPAARLLTISLWIICTILIATYTANLSSFLVVERSMPIISGIDDIKNAKIPFDRIGIVEGSASHEYYLNNISLIYYPLKSSKEIYTHLQLGLIDAGLWDNASIEYETSINYCDLMPVGRGFARSSFGIVVKKNWLYKEDLDVNILNLSESGIIEQLSATWFQQKKKCQKRDDGLIKSLDNSVTIEIMSGLLITFLLISFVSVLLHICYQREKIKMIFKNIKVKMTFMKCS
ncbi:unnamed protein product [Didymodactylos carnosus]|uniref:Ionotropic glutamate receptor C-terminal domain-containing protein n=1 Tax=Didymodactylos carnosus TaxID=1234261 RepID=A0A813YIF9_9BILA|nr:unnamed protein product [Didymodactylos carnosus]CAF3670435.1 unnamed protein product [Didymodactylos carnosus]